MAAGRARYGAYNFKMCCFEFVTSKKSNLKRLVSAGSKRERGMHDVYITKLLLYCQK